MPSSPSFPPFSLSSGGHGSITAAAVVATEDARGLCVHQAPLSAKGSLYYVFAAERAGVPTLLSVSLYYVYYVFAVSSLQSLHPPSLLPAEGSLTQLNHDPPSQ